MKRILTLLLAGLVLPLVLSCRKDPVPVLTGTWTLDHLAMVYSSGGTTIRQEIQTANFVAFLSSLPQTGTEGMDEEVLKHLTDVGVKALLQEDGTLTVTVSLRLDTGTGLSQEVSGTYLREDQTVTVCLNEQTVPFQIDELTGNSLILTLPMEALEGKTTGMGGELQIYFVR